MEWVWAEDGDEYEMPTGREVVVDPSRDGQLNRSCTHRWKIVTMRRWLQKYRRVEDWEGNLLGVRPVEQWLNISMDEWQRAKDSDVKYITNRFPLIEKRMTRNDCINDLERHGIEVPPKSSCTFCPFHNRAAWREMKAEDGADWREAVSVDEALRKVRPPFDLFLHTDRIPLIEVDLRTPTDHGHLDFWQSTCDSGYCWHLTPDHPVGRFWFNRITQHNARDSLAWVFGQRRDLGLPILTGEPTAAPRGVGHMRSLLATW